MDGAQDGLYVASNLEDDLADALTRTSNEVNYVECFDQEQRAEVYTILRAMTKDTQAHQSLAAGLVSTFAKEGGDA